MTADTPAAAATAEREALENVARKLELWEPGIGSIHMTADELFAFGTACAALSAPVAAPPAASGVDALWVDEAMRLSRACERAYASGHVMLAAREALRTHLSTALTGAAKDVK